MRRSAAERRLVQRRGQGPESASRAGSWVSAIAGRWRRGLTAAGRLAGRIRRWPERVPPRLRWVAAVGGLVAACLLLFAASAYMTLWVGVRAEVVTTPNLVGLPLDEARRVATSLGLELEQSTSLRLEPRPLGSLYPERHPELSLILRAKSLA